MPVNSRKDRERYAAQLTARLEAEPRFSFLRLGDGTDESHARVQGSLDNLWRYTGEMFSGDEIDRIFTESFGGPDLDAIHRQWETNVTALIAEATLTRPDDGWMAAGGKQGHHSEHLGYMIAEMQYLQRTHPGATW